MSIIENDSRKNVNAFYLDVNSSEENVATNSWST